MFKRKKESGAAIWLVAAGVLAGFATATVLALRARRRRADGLPSGELGELEKAVIKALRSDSTLRSRPIDVAAVAPGIVELSGSVETEEEAHHAVDVVQGVAVVRTVLNRLNLGEVERKLRRHRAVGGRPEGAGSRWYGMGVGMGRRRQSPSTDPDRRDDHADMVDDALAPSREEAINEAIDLADAVDEAPGSVARELS